MKRSWILISLFLLHANAYPCIAWAEEAKGPRMLLQEKAVDYREVDEGQIIEHVFKVLNQGDEPLEIRHVKPG